MFDKGHMFVSEVGDFIAKFGHLVGWTAMVGIAWKLRGAIGDQIDVWKNIDRQTKEACDEVAIVKGKVDTLQNNHMEHMQRSLNEIAESNDKAVTALQAIKEGIVVLVDRGKREMVVETRIKHVDVDSKES